MKAAVEALQEEEKLAAAAVGAEKVALRNARAVAEREQKARELAAVQKELQQRREQALERLLSSLPYNERLQQIKELADAARLQSHTAASAASAELSRAYAFYLAQYQAAQAGLLGSTGSGGEGVIKGPAGSVASMESSLHTATSHAALDFAKAAKVRAKEEKKLQRLQRMMEAEYGGSIPEEGEGGGEEGAGGGGGLSETGPASGLPAGSTRLPSIRRVQSAGPAVGGAGAGGLSSGDSTTAAPGAASSEALRRLAEYRLKEQGLFSRAGFADKQVTKDPRTRMLTAFYAAGIEGTAAARQAFSSFQPTGRGALQASRLKPSFSLAWPSEG